MESMTFPNSDRFRESSLVETSAHIFWLGIGIGFASGFCWGFVIQPLFF